MKRILYTIITLSCLVLCLLCGCRQTPDMQAGANALLDAVFKASPSEYSRLTGIATADISASRDEWLQQQTDYFLASYGGLTPSPQMREQISRFLGMVYTSADYSVRSSGQSVMVTIRPITLLTDQMPQIREWTEEFNSRNAAFEFYEQTSQEYADAYLDGVLTQLTSRLSDLPFADPVQIELPFERGQDQLFAFDGPALEKITKAILPFPPGASE